MAKYSPASSCFPAARSFARQQLTEDMSPTARPKPTSEFSRDSGKLRSGGQFTPPSFEGSMVFPGFDGGGEWGGATFDPERAAVCQRERDGLDSCGWSLAKHRKEPIPAAACTRGTAQAVIGRIAKAHRLSSRRWSASARSALVIKSRRRSRKAQAECPVSRNWGMPL